MLCRDVLSRTELTLDLLSPLPHCHHSSDVPMHTGKREFFPSLHSEHHTSSLFLIFLIAFGPDGDGHPQPLLAQPARKELWLHLRVSCWEIAAVTFPGRWKNDLPSALDPDIQYDC